jgi:hypothetical protein
MIHLDLTDEEQDRLREFLEINLGDLRMEISATSRLAVREDLKHTREVLQRVLERLKVHETA